MIKGEKSALMLKMARWNVDFLQSFTMPSRIS